MPLNREKIVFKQTLASILTLTHVWKLKSCVHIKFSAFIKLLTLTKLNMNPVYNPTASSLHPSPLFAPTPWVCHSGGQVGKSCCVSVPPYQPTLITSSPHGIASPDIYWGHSPFSGSRVGISYFASVPPVSYISRILPSPPYQLTLITSSPCGIALPNI